MVAQLVWTDIIDGGELPNWGDFGLESDAMCNGKPCYIYGADYNLSGTQHTGVDITAPLDSTIYAPFDAKVNCAGTGIGIAHDGSACAAFGDQFGSGAGRIELQSGDNAIIFGHSSTALVSPGDTVKAGTPIATVGGMNSVHSHIEARIPGGGTSGWQIIDPRTMLQTLGISPPDRSNGGHISTSKPFMTFGLLAVGVVLVVVGVRSLMTSSLLTAGKALVTTNKDRSG